MTEAAAGTVAGVEAPPEEAPPAGRVAKPDRGRLGKPGRPKWPWLPLSELDWVGCYPVRMTLEQYEGPGDERFEFWDSEAEIAWKVCEEPRIEHGMPTAVLVQLLARLAMYRGSPIVCGGEAGLRLLSPDGKRRRAMCPDQLVFKHVAHAPSSGRFEVGVQTYPDVVLEVDNTTDVRRNRLKLYEEWGFPELWVEVPNEAAPSRPRRLTRGLTIYLLDGDDYVISEESVAFPTWKATEIHRALNEIAISHETDAVLERVGRALGAIEGTGPEDDPVLSRTSAEAEARGRIEGRAQGQIEGAAGERAASVRAMLAARGVTVSGHFPAKNQRTALIESSWEAILAAGTVADSEADFFTRLRESDR